MRLFTFIAYDTEKDLGKAYNECVSLLDPEDWFVFLDHDAMFVQRDWYPMIKQAIEKNPEYGLFTCVTNRIGCPWQKVNGVEQDNHDIRYHKQIGKILSSDNLDIVDVTQGAPLSGVVIICQKKVWDLIGGAKPGFLSVDNDLHFKCRNLGVKVGVMPSLYVYHWYRGDGDLSHLK